MISVALFFSPKYKIPRLDTLVAIEGKLPILKYIFNCVSGELFLKINFQWKIKIIALFHLNAKRKANALDRHQWTNEKVLFIKYDSLLLINHT